MALLSSRSIKKPGETGHAVVFHEMRPGEGLKSWWEMYCSCGAWSHGNKEHVEHVAAVHRTETGERAP